jgi:methylated-DNA-protein-cysteine methyltransferase related protein
MPRSAAFMRIKTAVLAVTRAIPPGRVTSFRAVGALLDVVPRHVAYILATLSDEEKALVPWHRVVSDDGALERPKYDGSGRSQAELLAAEGAEIGAGQVVEDFEERFFAVTEETTGVGPVAREQGVQGEGA